MGDHFTSSGNKLLNLALATYSRGNNSTTTMSYPQLLLNKNKKQVATLLQGECSKSTETNQLRGLLVALLNPEKSIDDTEIVDWIKWLIAGGKTPTEFSNIVRSYDNGTTCGLVWTANFVAYRCRTCGISPCMSLCAECFQRGNHDGHDFNMFRSQAGGACDCGDSSVMKEAGFCDRHGPHAHQGKPVLPSNLLIIAQIAMPDILTRLILHLRYHSVPDVLGKQLKAVNSADSFITMLHDFSGMGAAMREVITSTLLNTQLYAQLAETARNAPLDPKGTEPYSRTAQKNYQMTLENLKGPEPPEECRGFPALQDVLEHRTFLEELVFWTVKLEFPQKLVCLLLNMLPDPAYKEAFTRAFVLHYARISRLLVGSADPDTLSNRVVHVSVQLFSNEELAMKMVEELHLLHVMVISLKDMMSKILIPSTLQDPKKNFHFVVDCSKHVMKDHCYWPLVSDLSNLLSHRPVALQFLSDDGLLKMWFSFLSMFQGMNVNKREMGLHVDFEPNTYYAAFSAELEAPASAMWALAIHLRDHSTVLLTRMLLRSCQIALEEWLEAISLHGPEQNDAYQVSFHIPLHRYLAAFTSQAVRSQGIPLKEILPPNHLLQLIMVHPLRIQAAFYEILSGLWVRNGLQIKGQAMSYIQCHFGNSMVDADLYLLQLCAMQLSPDMFLPLIFERFHVLGYLSMRNGTKSHFLEGEQESGMLESCLIFLSSLMVLRTNIGANESELDRLEMVSLLCMSDRTHSQLMEFLPEKCGAPQNKDFDAILTQVADYKAPNFEASGSMQQGMYVPKALVWEELYDPIYVLLRAVHRRDFQTSLDRFTQYVRQSGKHPNLATGTLWPPFRLPIQIHRGYEDPRKALFSRTFHAIVFVLLYKAVYTPSRINEQTLALVIYLLDLAVSYSLEQQTTHPNELCIANIMPKRSDDYVDLDFSRWFHGDCLHENVSTVINNVVFASPQAVVLSSTDAAELEVDSSSSSSSSSGSEAAYQAMDLDSPETGLRESSLAIAHESTSHPNGSASSSRTLLQTESNNTPSASGYRVIASPAELQLIPSNYLDETRGNELTKYFKDKRDASGARIPESGAQGDRLTVRESIISLLLRLYSTFGGPLECYDVPETHIGEGKGFTFNSAEDARIGNGRFWIKKVLDKLCYLHPNVLHAVKTTVQALNEARNTKAICFSGTEDLSESEKKRRIKERQQRLLQEFANKQREFMQHAMAAEQMETDIESMPGDTKTPSPNQESEQLCYTPEAPKELQRTATVPTYDCVICNQSSPSTIDRPMCLVILLQPTNMLQKPSPSSEAVNLPVNPDHMSEFKRHQANCAEEEQQRLDVLEKFSSVFSYVESKVDGRIFVQTCGHCLHLDCQKQYLQALRTQQRHQTMDVEHGEYACPLCRQLANSALPIVSGLSSGVPHSSSSGSDLSECASDIMQILSRHTPIVSPSVVNIMKAIDEVVEDMINMSIMYRKPNESTSNPRSLSVFLRTTARANIEIELMQRNDSLGMGPFHEQTPITAEQGSDMNPSQNLYDESSQSFSQEQSTSSKFNGKASAYSWPLLPKRSCLASLLQVLATQRKALNMRSLSDIWKKVTGQDSLSMHGRFEKSRVEEERKAPSLTLDPISLLVEFTLCLPMIQKHQYRCLVQHLYNLLATQTIILRSQAMSNDKKKFYKENCICDWPLAALVSCVIRKLDTSPLELDESRNSDAYSAKISCKDDFENYLHERAMKFLRVATVLQHYFLDSGLPSVSSNASMRNEFDVLCSYLNVSWKPTLSGEKDFTLLVENWFNELKFASGTSKEVCEVIALYHQRFFTPRLLVLPRAYDAIFQFYHRATCGRCFQVPKEPSVCLSCGKMVCLRESCCKNDNIHEVVQHSIECGAGTAIFLAINSSTIIVIRGKRACLWGSVYLDVFGEEDRELKRGKPLYLSNERYELLERQWLSHRFDHTNKKWIWHRDAL